MPQTRFVTQKAFGFGLKPIVVVNKIDRKESEPDRVINEVFDLFDNLGATEEQLDFPMVYTSAISGQAGVDPELLEESMSPLLDMIVSGSASRPVYRWPFSNADKRFELLFLRGCDGYWPRQSRQN